MTTPPLYWLHNGSFSLFTPNVSASTSETVYCLDDPFYAYTLLAAVDLLAYCVPCVTRSTYPAPRACLFALNLALVANIVFDVDLQPAYGISWLFIGTVAVLGLVFYWLVGAFALFVTLIGFICAAFFNASDFAKAWISNLIGLQLSTAAVNTVLFFFGLAVIAVGLYARTSRLLQQIVDSFVYSVLFVFGLQFVFFELLDHRSDSWMGSGFMPSPTQLCCDDYYVICPVWFDWVSMFYVLITALTRLSFVLFMEEAEAVPPPVHPETKPLISVAR